MHEHHFEGIIITNQETQGLALFSLVTASNWSLITARLTTGTMEREKHRFCKQLAILQQLHQAVP